MAFWKIQKKAKQYIVHHPETALLVTPNRKKHFNVRKRGTVRSRCKHTMTPTTTTRNRGDCVSWHGKYPPPPCKRARLRTTGIKLPRLRYECTDGQGFGCIFSPKTSPLVSHGHEFALGVTKEHFTFERQCSLRTQGQITICSFVQCIVIGK